MSDIDEQPPTDLQQVLRHLEDATQLFTESSSAQPPGTISDTFPTRLSNLINALTEFTTRHDAERLLVVGKFSQHLSSVMCHAAVTSRI